MKATVGRIVWYYDEADSSPTPAIIRAVTDGRVTLLVLQQPPWEMVSDFSDTPKSGCWTWPKREPDAP